MRNPEKTVMFYKHDVRKEAVFGGICLPVLDQLVDSIDVYIRSCSDDYHKDDYRIYTHERPGAPKLSYAITRTDFTCYLAEAGKAVCTYLPGDGVQRIAGHWVRLEREDDDDTGRDCWGNVIVDHCFHNSMQFGFTNDWVKAEEAEYAIYLEKFHGWFIFSGKPECDEERTWVATAEWLNSADESKVEYAQYSIECLMSFVKRARITGF